MKTFLIACLVLVVTVPLEYGKNDKNSTEETLIQMEQDWSQADIKRDAAALNRTLAEDWIGIDFEGTVLNKAGALKGIDSNSGSLQSTVLRDMKVRVYGSTAVVTGTDTEKGEFHGKDSSGKYLWTDVFVRRNGRWQAVSSQSTKLTAQGGPQKFAWLRNVR